MGEWSQQRSNIWYRDRPHWCQRCQCEHKGDTITAMRSGAGEWTYYTARGPHTTVHATPGEAREAADSE